MSINGTPFYVQDLMRRFVFDVISTMILGADPGLLSSDMPSVHVAIAMDTFMEVGLFRHIVPASCWKTMRRLNIGPERKLTEAHTVLRRFVTDMLEIRTVTCTGHDDEHEGEATVDVVSSYIDDPDYNAHHLLPSVLINYMVARRDTIGITLPWHLYNLAKNPSVVSRIRKEMEPIASRKLGATKGADATVTFEPEETKDLVYLQAALFETLRLYPPVPIERMTVLADDVLPSGHEVHSGETILISIYTVGRLEDVWGKDWLVYSPQRWLSDNGSTLRYVPSHKFLAFNSGPRICPGKAIAVILMKTAISNVVCNFDLELLPGHDVEPKLSCILLLKNRLMFKAKMREKCNIP